MQDTIRFPQVWPVYSGPAGLTPLRNRLRRRQKAVAPKGVPSSLSDHVGIIPHHDFSGHPALFQSATPFLPMSKDRGFRGWFW